MQIYTKFANFTGLYFPHFTTIRNQTLQDALSSYGNGFRSSCCLDQNFVYSWNHPFTLTKMPFSNIIIGVSVPLPTPPVFMSLTLVHNTLLFLGIFVKFKATFLSLDTPAA
jgi:hypothetical protein